MPMILEKISYKVINILPRGPGSLFNATSFNRNNTIGLMPGDGEPIKVTIGASLSLSVLSVIMAPLFLPESQLLF